MEADKKPFWPRLHQSAHIIKRDVLALCLAARDPRVPWYAKVLAGSVAAYALCPIDLIPDFIPVLGYLDDVIIVPIGILLAVKLIPADVMSELRAAARTRSTNQPTSRIGIAMVVVIWLFAAAAIIWWAADFLRF